MVEHEGDGLRPSILDRLISEPTGATEISDIRVSLDEVKASVRRDIEWLLNSRQFLTGELQHLPEVENSLLTYGLPDLSVYSPSRVADNVKLCHLITRLLERFEPRLLSEAAITALRKSAPPELAEEYSRLRPVEVSRAESPRDHRLSSMFKISGTLHVDPIFADVVFHTRVEFDTGSVEVIPAQTPSQ